MAARHGPLFGPHLPCLLALSLPLLLALSLSAPWLLLVRAQGTPSGSVGYETPFCNRFVRYGGLQCDEYVVTTQDGYVLSFQRIRNTTVARGLPGRTIPVLLDHALMLGADLWFGLVAVRDRTLGKRLPVLLAGRGHDVFVMSHRCTQWSQPHVRYNTRDWQYWDWSWDEQVFYDLPAVIGQILSITGAPKLHFVGHHMGGTIPLALAATQPAYAAKVLASVTSLGPIAYLGNTPSPVLRQWANGITPDELIYSNHLLYGAYNLSATQVLINALNSTGIDFFALTGAGSGSNPEDLFNQITGPQCCRDLDAPPIAPDQNWVATSYRQLMHLQQQLRTGRWQKWDFLSASANYQNYGTAAPPLIYPANIPAALPIFIISGQNDWFADPRNIQLLVTNIGRPVKQLQVFNYSNIDLVWSSRGPQDVFLPVAAYIEGGFRVPPS